MKLAKLSMIAAIVGLSSVMSVAQAAGHNCGKGKTYKKGQCVARKHACTDKQHWDVKTKRCVDAGTTA